MKSVKFSVFADLHHFPGVFYTDAPKRLDIIRRRAQSEAVDLVIHCGDMLHRPSEEKELLAQYNDFPVPTYHCIGNHECEDSFPAVLRAFGLETGYYFFDKNGFRFIVLDLNYMLIDGNPVHYDKGNFFGRPAGAELVTFPKFEREWFKNAVSSSPYPCIVISHQSLEREHNGMSKAEQAEIKEMLYGLREKILLIINGHHHVDNLKFIDGIPYLDLNSSSYIWYDTPHDKYPTEMVQKNGLVLNTLVYNDPVHAVITLRDDGYIKIEGMNSSFIFGIGPIEAGLDPLDIDSRAITPNVLSAMIGEK